MKLNAFVIILVVCLAESQIQNSNLGWEKA